MASIDIRMADFTDPAVHSLACALDDDLAGLYPPASNHGLSSTALQAANVRVATAELAGRPAGCAALRRDAAYGEVKRMVVLPEARGTGIGRAVLAHLELLARADGLPCMRLETGVSQPDALGLYETAGFRRIEFFLPYRPDPLGVFMEKALSSGALAPIQRCIERAGAFP